MRTVTCESCDKTFRKPFNLKRHHRNIHVQPTSFSKFKMEWPNELVLEFLKYYENEPIIWNPSLDAHKNRNEVYDAWKRIEYKMKHKFSVTELKKKKDSLMASFRSCLKKVKDSCKSGSETSDIYKPNWFAYAVMEKFLRDKNQPRQTLSSEEILLEDSDPIHQVNDEEYEESDSTEPDIIQENKNIVLMKRGLASKSTSRKKIKTSDEAKIKMILCDSAYATLQENLKTQKKTLCDIYGELVVAKLKDLDSPDRDIAMHRIDNIFFEMKMSKINPTASSTTDHNYQFSPPHWSHSSVVTVPSDTTVQSTFISKETGDSPQKNESQLELVTFE